MTASHSPLPTPDSPFARSPLIIAHRGDSRAAPENTLPSLTAAANLGADAVEFDYWHSADGVPMSFHDETLDRATDAVKLWGGENLRLSDRSLAELQQLDAGHWFAPQFAGTRIPTMAEALEAILPKSLAMIERKGGDAATCLRVLAECHALPRVTVQAFDWQFLADCHRLAPELVLGALGEKELQDDHLTAARDLGASIVGWEAAYIGADEIERIHRHGLKAWVWTVDDPARARELLAAGIDGIISNVPGAMMRVRDAFKRA